METRALGSGKGAPANRQIGGPFPSKIAVGTLTVNRPKLSLKQSGIGADDQFMDAVDSYITSLSSDLNTPDIKLDEIMDGTNPYSFSNYNMEVKSEPTHGVGPATRLGCSTTQEENSEYPSKSTVLFDLSPLPAVNSPQSDQVDQQVVDMQEQFTTPHGCGMVTSNSSFLVATTPAPDTQLYRPQPPPSPSDFLIGNKQPQVRQVSGSVNLSTLCSADATSALDTENEFDIPPDIMEQVNSLLPLSLDTDNVSLDSTPLDMFLGNCGNFFTGVQETGLLENETFDGPTEAAGNTLPELPTEGTENIYQVNTTTQTQYQKTLYVESLPSTSEVTSYSQTVGTESVWPLIESHILSETVGAEPDRCTSESQTFSQQSNGFERLLSPSPVVSCHTPSSTPKTKVRGSKAAVSTIGPIRVSRKKRSSMKPIRFRDTVPYDVSSTTDLDFLAESPEGPVASTSGHMTSSRRNRQSMRELTEEEKYHRIRELNNEASKRCRQKRKETLMEMEVQLASLEEENKKLKQKEAALTRIRDKVQSLVNDMFAKRLASHK